MTSRIFGLMVARNEADRYLEACVKWHLPMVERLLVVDDRSEDETRRVALEAGATVCDRPDGVPTFMEDEASFRQFAWQQLGDLFDLTDDDWVLCIDADEFVTGADHPDHIPQQMRSAMMLTELVEGSGSTAVYQFHVDEIFALDDDRAYRRVDGAWGKITASRLARWDREALFPQRKGLGCGSIPVIDGKPVQVPRGLVRIAHLGYANPTDRQAKYDRYSGDRGHSTKHVQSILNMPELSEVEFPCRALVR